MKKTFALALAALMSLFLLAGCGGGQSSSDPTSSTAPSALSTGVPAEELKIGVIHIMELGDQGYTYNHDQGVKLMLKNLGLSEEQYIPKFNINDQDVAATNAAISELVDAGCQIIFATSFSYGAQVVEAARQYPDVQFCHATGTDAHTNDLPNLHNYFAKIHQARYLGGIAAGLKAAELGQNKLGYVAAYPYAEVISGFTAFFLGARSVNPDVTMDVMYIDSWGDTVKERQVAEALADRGCVVISQHSDNVSPALAAQDKGIFHVGYNNDMAPAAPGASLISARIDWGIYMTLAVQCMIDGTPIPLDWSEGIESGAAYLSPLNEAIAAEGTAEAIASAEDMLYGGMLIFSGALKDAEGNPAQINDWDGNAVFTFEDENSAFEESAGQSAPMFNALIEGITVVS